MKGKILVLAEHKDGRIDNITLELLGKGRAIADRWETFLAVLLVGADLDAMADTLKDSGADVVITAQDDQLNNYNAELYTAVIAQAVKSYNPTLILMGYTYLGMEVGPALSVRLGGTIVTNCTELDADGEILAAVRSVFSGTLQSEVELVGSAPYIVSLEKGILPRQTLESKNAVKEDIAVDIGALTLRSRIVEIFTAANGDIDITQSKILVSVGRGIGSSDKIALAKELADVLHGQLACSRPVVDMGWLPFAYQVGISASTISPDIYIACGISGASQHVTAMRDSGTIIAINKDPNAPIFRVADYGIVGDVLEVVPAMIAEVADT